jgi:hypothetical protein
MLQHVSLSFSVVVFVFFPQMYIMCRYTQLYRSHQHSHTKVWYNKVETHERSSRKKGIKKKNNNFSVLKLRTSESIYRIHIEFSVSVRELCLYSSSGWTTYICTLFCVFLLHFCARTWATIFFLLFDSKNWWKIVQKWAQLGLGGLFLSRHKLKNKFKKKIEKGEKYKNH